METKVSEMSISTAENSETPEFAKYPDIYSRVKGFAEYALELHGKTNSENTLSSAELLAIAKDKYPVLFPVSFSKPTFYAYLSKIARDPNARIATKGIRQGYYIDDIKIDPPQQEDQTPATQSLRPEKNQKEKQLYPSLKGWLVAQGYQANDISTNRSLGKWGNPDVAGIGAADAFNSTAIEITTIEAKSSSDNWEQWIFEAVSHRRFSNRAYFAFAHPEGAITKIPKEMRYYAELYQIGILVVAMKDSRFVELHNGVLDLIDPEDVEILEIYSAPYNFVQPRYQIKFCEALGIKSLKDLYGWGISG